MTVARNVRSPLNRRNSRVCLRRETAALQGRIRRESRAIRTTANRRRNFISLNVSYGLSYQPVDRAHEPVSATTTSRRPACKACTSSGGVQRQADRWDGASCGQRAQVSQNVLCCVLPSEGSRRITSFPATLPAGARAREGQEVQNNAVFLRSARSGCQPAAMHSSASSAWGLCQK